MHLHSAARLLLDCSARAFLRHSASGVSTVLSLSGAFWFRRSSSCLIPVSATSAPHQISMLTRLLFTPARSIATSSFRLFANNAEVELRATQLRLETLKREEDKLKSKKKTLVVRVRASAEREKALDQKFREKERELIKKEKLREQQLAAKAKADAIPKKPTRALTAVSAFIKLNYADVKKSLAADTKPTEVLKAAALKFKNASAAEKQAAESIVQQDRERYAKEMATYEAIRPKRALTKYAIFVKEQYPILKAANPTKNFIEISGLIKNLYSQKK